MHFTATNPEQLIYDNAIFNIEVLGGVRLEGLDRLRVTLKVSLNQSEVPPLRHNLDLYNDTQLEKFIRKIAERLEVGSNAAAGTLAELTGQLENYRLEKIKEQNNEPTYHAKPLTETEKAEAIKNLQQENLLQQTIQDLKNSGIQGEAENALILLLAMTSRKTPDPMSVICLAKSGTGKSYLMERVALCIPDEDKKEHTQFTSNAFYYYKKEEIRNKIFLIEDLEGAMDVLFPIRELQSKKRISKTITQKGRDGKLQTITLVVEGPVCVIACTTKESIYEDNANRSLLIYLNDSKIQDEKVMHYQKQHRAGLVDIYQEQQTQTKLQHMQKALEPIRVINPFAPLIDLPDNFPKKRRALPILLNFIEAITFYHQYQRTEAVSQDTGEMYIQSTVEDIQNGYHYLRDVLCRRNDELAGAVRNFYEQLKTILENRITETNTEENVQANIEVNTEASKKFKAVDIRPLLQMAPRTFYHYIKILIEYDYILVVGGKQRTGYEYELQNIITQNHILENMDQHITRVIDNIKQSIQIVNTTKKEKTKKVLV
jgi:hypothetical protein